MSKDIKDLIDLYEEENQEKSEIQQTISFMKEEIERLNFTIEEQKKLIQELKKEKEKEDAVPNDIQILKDLVKSQREEISEKNKRIENLTHEIDDLIEKVEEQSQGGESPPDQSEELLNTKRFVVQLTEINEELEEEIDHLKAENEKLRENQSTSDQDQELQAAHKQMDRMTLEIENLQEHVISLQQELMEQENLIDQESLPDAEQNQQVQDAENQINNLIAENTELKQKLEEATRSEELQLANKKIESLILEIEDLEAQVNYLKKELEKKESLEAASLLERELREQDDPRVQQVIEEGTIKEDIVVVQDVIQYQEEIEELKEENASYRQGIERLNTQIKNLQLELENMVPSEELDLANKKIEALILEIEDFEAQISYLQQEVDSSKQRPEVPEDFEKEMENQLAVKTDTIEQLKDEIESLKKELEIKETTVENLVNEIHSFKDQGSEQEETIIQKTIKIEALTEQIESLKRKNTAFQDEILQLNASETIEISPDQQPTNKISSILNPSIPYQKHLVLQLFSYLNDNQKQQIIDLLIENLGSTSRDLKVFSIEILKEVNQAEVLVALLDLIEDNDWIVRFYLVRALKNYMNFDLREPLQKLAKDRDVDVREMALGLLKKIQ